MRWITRTLVLGLPLLTGCVDGELNRSFGGLLSKSEATPAGREPALEAAARVDLVGRKIAAANLFTGIEPTFQVIGHQDPVIFHRDSVGVFLTDSLVVQCQTDTELAAVLCTELGKMVAERRNAARMGYQEPLNSVPIQNSLEAGGITGDQFRLAELALMEERMPKRTLDKAREPATDPRKIAGEMLRTAGYEENDLAAAEPILKSANKNRDIIRQLGGPASAPTWSR